MDGVIERVGGVAVLALSVGVAVELCDWVGVGTMGMVGVADRLADCVGDIESVEVHQATLPDGIPEVHVPTVLGTAGFPLRHRVSPT